MGEYDGSCDGTLDADGINDGESVGDDVGDIGVGDFVGDDVGLGVIGAGLGRMGGVVIGALVTGMKGASVCFMGAVTGDCVVGGASPGVGGFAALGAAVVVWAIAIDGKLVAVINIIIIVAATMFCIL